MNSQSLCGDWEFRQVGETEWLNGFVPGGVHTDLMNLEIIPDPFVADNELKVMWVAEKDWEYRYRFSVEQNIITEQKIFLVCDGLDTIADIYLNDHYLGHVENMFRSWEWDVKQYLHQDLNELQIIFASPVQFICSRQAQLPLQGGGDIPGGPHLRKAPCHWGWDWGPKLPPVGIWKDIRLEGRSYARLQNVRISQNHRDDGVDLSAEITCEGWGEEEFSVSMTLTEPDGKIKKIASDVFIDISSSVDRPTIIETKIENPQLWWPNGYGAQPLYQLSVQLNNGDTIVDEKRFQIGLRTIELRQPKDEWGKSFTFYVNGVPLFAKGADWIPADSFPTRITEGYLESLINSAAEAHMNMLRVWGGGYYPEESFFDLCDRYGILVWQDFMFACGIYPADSDFFENVKAEVVENVRRIRHRACLALWCGNNEMEQGWCDWGWNKPNDSVNQRLKDGYDRMFHTMLPDVLKEEDPDHPYWPSSASSGVAFDTPNGQVQGDCHYWDVWHGRKPFTAYRSQFPRFMSEFGFQALPPFKTIETYAEPADQNMTSYVMEHHQRSGSGNGLMIGQMTDSFRMPKDFQALVYLSLVLQAEGIRYGVEHWRRNRKRVSGTLYWQLNDCWPVASWASLDYFGRWKALHYAARKFYAPLLMSVEDTGAALSIHLTSDLMLPTDVVLKWRLENIQGVIFSNGERRLRVPALQDLLVEQLNFTHQFTSHNQMQLIFVCELYKLEGGIISRTIIPFVPNKHLQLVEPDIKSDLRIADNNLIIQLTASSLARFVELDVQGLDVVFSDNYFDLPANASVQITCELPLQWNIELAKKALVIRSLYDSYM